MMRVFTTKRESGKEIQISFSRTSIGRKVVRGFTLIETVIIIAITAMMMISLATLFVNFNSLYVYQQTFTATVKSAGGAINAIGDASLPANQVLASHIFSSGTISSGATSFALELPSVDSSGNILAGKHDYIGFYLTGTDLYRRTEADASSVRASGTKKVATLVSSLSFTYDNTDFTKVTNVTANIVTQLNTKKGLVQTHLNEQFYLRNI